MLSAVAMPAVDVGTTHGMLLNDKSMQYMLHTRSICWAERAAYNRYKVSMLHFEHHGSLSLRAYADCAIGLRSRRQFTQHGFNE